MLSWWEALSVGAAAGVVDGRGEVSQPVRACSAGVAVSKRLRSPKLAASAGGLPDTIVVGGLGTGQTEGLAAVGSLC